MGLQVFGNSFLKTMLMALRQPETLRVVSDQRGAPTGAAYIADATALVLARYGAAGGRGLSVRPVPLAATGDASWHEYACFIARQARRAGPAVTLTPADIRAVPSHQYPTTARRPLNSRLDSRLLERTFGIRAPHWEDGVTHALAAIADSRNWPDPDTLLAGTVAPMSRKGAQKVLQSATIKPVSFAGGASPGCPEITPQGPNTMFFPLARTTTRNFRPMSR